MSNSPDIFSTSKIAAIIPARFASTRFPGKPLVSLSGKPMIQWVIEGVKTSQYVTDIYVATDHPEIVKVAESCGVRALMTSLDCQTGSDRVYQALQFLKKENKNYNYVLNVQGDEPLISKNYIDPLAQALLAGIVALSVSNFFGFSTVMVNVLMFWFMAVLAILAQPADISDPTIPTSTTQKNSKKSFCVEDKKISRS